MSGAEPCWAIGHRSELHALDDRLLNALFSPAVEAGVADLTWLDPANENRGWDLLRHLLPLSEFYQQRNQPLSAAIWGIWNTARHLRNNRSFLAMLFDGRRAKEELFGELRALLATAAIQFADGTAATVGTSHVDMATYRQYTELTLARLTSAAAGSCGLTNPFSRT